MKYGLIGEHLTHSYSCEIHAQIADYEYELHELRPDELGEFMTKREFNAINVTIPYKQDVIPYLDEISETAKRIGAVNTIVNRNGKLYGDNTDFPGMLALAKHADVDMKGKKVLILGTGGASKTAHALAEFMGAESVDYVSRSGKGGSITYEQAAQEHSDAQIIINATPAGMFPKVEGRPIDISAFPKLEGVLDAIYNPLRTNLILDAQERGIPAEGGLYMLSAQAVYASAVFQSIELDESLIKSAFDSVKNAKQNIVLVGMPSSGKTTVGTILSGILGKKFLDADTELEARAGRPITEIIPQDGEAAFRKLESDVLKDLGKQSGLVIATGGGCVTIPANYEALHRNGTIVWLKRDLDALPTDGRPLSQVGKLDAMYQKRAPMYAAFSDFSVENTRSPEKTAEEICQRLSEGRTAQ